MMTTLHAWLERIWWENAPPPFLLRCIEPFYAAISRIHLQRRAAAVTEPPLPLISVGNITAGGSGKTPFVLWLAGVLKSNGYAPIILCRGDGGRAASARLVKPDDHVRDVGDETKMLADLSDCPVIVAADRIAGSQLAGDLGDIVILDDGFQYRHLGRCCDIVLVPAEGVGNGHQIPAGPLREPISALSRAGIVVRTGNAEALKNCSTLDAGKSWYWERLSGQLINATGNHTLAMPESVYAVTAIARPQRFFDDLKAIGLDVVGSRSYADHHPFTDRDIDEILQCHADIAVTAKDAVKLTARWPKQRPLWLLPLSGKPQSGLISAVLAQIPGTKQVP